MNSDAALKFAQQAIDSNLVVLPETTFECEFGYYFRISSKPSQTTDATTEMLGGISGVLVERATGAIHSLSSSHDRDYWLEAYQRGLHKPLTVVVTRVLDRQRGAEALHRLNMSRLIVEATHSETWRIAKPFTVKELRESFERLPARYPNQFLLGALQTLKQLEVASDIQIQLEPEQNI